MVSILLSSHQNMAVFMTYNSSYEALMLLLKVLVHFVLLPQEGSIGIEECNFPTKSCCFFGKYGEEF